MKLAQWRKFEPFDDVKQLKNRKMDNIAAAEINEPKQTLHTFLNMPAQSVGSTSPCKPREIVKSEFAEPSGRERGASPAKVGMQVPVRHSQLDHRLSLPLVLDGSTRNQGLDEEAGQNSQQSANSSLVLAEKIRKLPMEKAANRKIANILRPLLEPPTGNFNETQDFSGIDQVNSSIYTILNSFDGGHEGIPKELQGRRRSLASQEITDRQDGTAVEQRIVNEYVDAYRSRGESKPTVSAEEMYQTPKNST